MINALEERVLLAMSVVLEKATLKIQGSERSNEINVEMAASQVQVTIDSVGFTIPAGKVKKISINGARGNDRITVANSIRVSVDIFGGMGNDYVRGGVRPTRFFGELGNDTLAGGQASDLFSGGPGIDTVDYSSRARGLRITLDGKPNDGEIPRLGQPAENDNVTADVENIIGGAGDDYIVGNGLANTLIGGAGGDTLIGQAGNDVLVGGPGADLLQGGAGDDVLLGIDQSAGDILNGNAGFDSASLDSVLGVRDRLLSVECEASVLGE